LLAVGDDDHLVDSARFFEFGEFGGLLMGLRFEEDDGGDGGRLVDRGGRLFFVGFGVAVVGGFFMVVGGVGF
jgi:hypothetical protein